MKNLTLSTAVLALAAGAALADGHGVVRMGTEGAYPPYNFINDAGEVDGFERELGDELCARAELTCEWVTNEWDSIIPNLVSGNYDTIIAGMSVTDERKEVISFSEQYTLPDPSAYLALQTGSGIVAGSVIAAQAGTIQAAYIASTDATLLEFATPEETVAAVRNGEADAVLADKSYLAPIAEAEADLALVEQEVMIGGGIGIGIRQSDTELKAKFDAAIMSMKKDGSLNELIGKWLPEAALFPAMAMETEEASVVRMGTEGAYPPYNFINDAGEVDGFERELGDELCVRAELTCEWVTNEWDSIIPNLVSGNYDTIIAGMSVTDERKEVIAFSEQYTLPDPSAYLALNTGSGIVAGSVIAAQAGTIQAAYIASTDATLLEFATPEETVAAVRNGEADAVLADKSYLAPIAEAEAELSLVEQEVMIGGGIGIGLRQSDEDLKAKFDAAIMSMKADGTLNALIGKWLPEAAQF